ncbi:hypothetical protein [Flavimarina sp. Hel_I_48]|uniref:bestrophin-like domain n=1 Tax=Flavimarina sp. Hel_I_48 TaxID=1392488 RepID=UPI0019D015AE|nr:hypothetical protein [Flavimarina sp. Hel_I_48]
MNSILIALILFIVIVIANELGMRLGQYHETQSNSDIKSQTTAIQGGILGLLALILGFTFNMSLQRFDNRAAAEVAEANAIGTALLRTSLLPDPYNVQEEGFINEYINLRLAENKTDLTQKKLRATYHKKVQHLQQQIWDTAINAADEAPNPVKTGYFVQAVNDMIDAQGYRTDQLERHVPPAIFYLLFVIFIATGALIGYATGLGKRTSRTPALVLSFLISLLVFIIVDLDRPRRGIIQVKQDSMENLIDG